MDILKTIILVLLILGVIGALIYFSYQILTTPSSIDYNIISDDAQVSEETKRETRVRNTTTISNSSNDSLDDSSNDSLNESEELEESEDDRIKLNFSKEELTSIYGTGLSINNNNPKTDFNSDNFKYTGFTLDTNTKVTFYYPTGWLVENKSIKDPTTNSHIEVDYSKTGVLLPTQVYEETTYDDIITAFIERARSLSENPDNVEITTRELETADGSFPIIVKSDSGTVTSYIVFIKGLYEYHLEFICPEDSYREDFINKIDNVFSSYKII